MPTWPCNTRCSFSALNDTISKDRIWKSACRDLSTWVYRKLLSAFWKNRGVKNLFFTRYIHNQLRQPAVWRPLLMPRDSKRSYISWTCVRKRQTHKTIAVHTEQTVLQRSSSCDSQNGILSPATRQNYLSLGLAFLNVATAFRLSESFRISRSAGGPPRRASKNLWGSAMISALT